MHESSKFIVQGPTIQSAALDARFINEYCVVRLEIIQKERISANIVICNPITQKLWNDTAKILYNTDFMRAVSSSS